MFNKKKKQQKQRAAMMELLLSLAITIVWAIIVVCTFGTVNIRKTNVYVFPGENTES
mgnify:CR=1 FL=1